LKGQELSAFLDLRGVKPKEEIFVGLSEREIGVCIPKE
jgi:hypothetical protein